MTDSEPDVSSEGGVAGRGACRSMSTLRSCWFDTVWKSTYRIKATTRRCIWYRPIVVLLKVIDPVRGGLKRTKWDPPYTLPLGDDVGRLLIEQLLAVHAKGK